MQEEIRLRLEINAVRYLPFSFKKTTVRVVSRDGETIKIVPLKGGKTYTLVKSSSYPVNVALPSLLMAFLCASISIYLLVSSPSNVNLWVVGTFVGLASGGAFLYADKIKTHFIRFLPVSEVVFPFLLGSLMLLALYMAYTMTGTIAWGVYATSSMLTALSLYPAYYLYANRSRLFRVQEEEGFVVLVWSLLKIKPSKGASTNVPERYSEDKEDKEVKSHDDRE